MRVEIRRGWRGSRRVGVHFIPDRRFRTRDSKLLEVAVDLGFVEEEGSVVSLESVVYRVGPGGRRGDVGGCEDELSLMDIRIV